MTQVSQSRPTGALAGVRVLDMSRVLAIRVDGHELRDVTVYYR